MEQLDVINDSDLFEEIVRNGPAEDGHIKVIYKPCGTKEKRGVVVITWGAYIDGKVVQVQAVTTVRQIMAIAHCLRGWEENANGDDFKGGGDIGI